MTRLEKYIADRREKVTTQSSAKDDTESSWKKLRNFQFISGDKGNDNETYLHRYLNQINGIDK